MIELYGKFYAPDGAAYLDHVEEGMNGTYRRESGGIVFSDLTGKERAFIRRDGLGPVSIAVHSDGARYYMHSTSSLDDSWLGIPSSYMEEVNGAKEVAQKAYP